MLESFLKFLGRMKRGRLDDFLWISCFFSMHIR